MATTAAPTHPAVATAARNLLEGCAALPAGARVLFVGEAGQDPFFDPAVSHALAEAARDLGYHAEVLLAAPVPSAAEFPAEVRAAMRKADLTVFHSRLGGQARFALTPEDGRAVNGHAMTLAHLTDPFCTTDHASLRRVHDALVARIAAASTYTLTAPCGTDLRGRVPGAGRPAMAGFALDLFPPMIFPPILSDGLEGVLVIDRFVTSTATRAYDDSILRLNAPLRATLRDSRIVALEGAAGPVARLRTQMQRAASLTGGDPMRVNSWHTGINPNTFTATDPMADPDRWGAVAFGSPRYTHFHAAGNDPGDVAFSVFDATIAFDGETFWEAGRFVFLDRPEIAALIAPGARAQLHSGLKRPIGV